MRIYESPCPPVELPRCSVFSYVFPTPDRHPTTAPIFIDAVSGFVVHRGEFRQLALSLAYGVTHFYPSGPPRGLLNGVLAKPRGFPLQRGQVAMIFMPNALSYPLIFFGLQAAGVRTTLANASYTPRELAHQMADSAAEVVFVHPSLLSTLEKAWGELGVDVSQARSRTVLADWEPWNKTSGVDLAYAGRNLLSSLLFMGSLSKEEMFDGEKSDEIALLCYSSGTTGLSKGVATTHYNATSNVTISKAWHDFKPNDVVLGCLPLYHIFAAVLNALYWPAFGVPLVIQAGFTPDSFCANIARYQVTTAFVVPPILLALAKHSAPEKYDMRTFRRAVSGAAPLSESLVTAVTTRLENLGCKGVVITQGYGLTETSPSVFHLADHLSRKLVGSVGVLLSNLQARLVLDDDGKEDAPDGHPGDLWVRGPTIMKGYLHNPKATKEAITKDGWFKTGDVAIRNPEGYFYIVDRKKELIKYKGSQVPPADLEAVLISHPEIVDAAVIGVYSTEQETELPRAYVVHASGLDSFKTAGEKAKFEQDITAWVASKVAKHKEIRGGVVVIDSIPKSAAGKILRRQLRERVKEETGCDPVTGKPVDTRAKL